MQTFTDAIFRENKTSRNCEITLSFTEVQNNALVANFNVTRT